MEEKVDLITLLAFGFVVLIAGTNFVAVKYSNQELAPFWGAYLRFFSASILLFIYVIAKKIPLPTGKNIQGAILYGIFGFGASYALMYWALLSVSSGIASITVALVPLLTFFLAIIHGLEEFRTKALIGSLISAFGITLIFYQQLNTFVSLMPLLALIAATICISETGIIIKLYPKVPPLSMNATGMLVGAIMLFAFSRFFNEPMTVPTMSENWIALIYLILIGSIVLFMLVIFTLKRWSASAVSYQLVLAPIITMVLVYFLRGEVVSTLALVGSFIVVSGVYMGALSSSKSN